MLAKPDTSGLLTRAQSHAALHTHSGEGRGTELRAGRSSAYSGENTLPRTTWFSPIPSADRRIDVSRKERGGHVTRVVTAREGSVVWAMKRRLILKFPS